MREPENKLSGNCLHHHPLVLYLQSWHSPPFTISQRQRITVYNESLTGDQGQNTPSAKPALVAQQVAQVTHRDTIINKHLRGFPLLMWGTGGKRENLFVLLSLLNFIRTKFVDFTYSVLGSWFLPSLTW